MQKILKNKQKLQVKTCPDIPSPHTFLNVKNYRKHALANFNNNWLIIGGVTGKLHYDWIYEGDVICI